MGNSVRYVVFYDSGDLSLAAENFPAHRAWYGEFMARGVLLSLHLKATMMKVSDPILFGHAVTVYYKDAFAKHAALFGELGVDADNGIGDVYAKIQSLPAAQQAQVAADLAATYQSRPALAMVDSDKGITNLHVPSDVIIDASMPAAIRTSGRMWGPDGKAHDMKAMIRDQIRGKASPQGTPTVPGRSTACRGSSPMPSTSMTPRCATAASRKACPSPSTTS